MSIMCCLVTLNLPQNTSNLKTYSVDDEQYAKFANSV